MSRRSKTPAPSSGQYTAGAAPYGQSGAAYPGYDGYPAQNSASSPMSWSNSTGQYPTTRPATSVGFRPEPGFDGNFHGSPRSFTPAPGVWSYPQPPPPMPPPYGQQAVYGSGQYYPQAPPPPAAPIRPVQAPNRHRDGNFVNWTPADMSSSDNQPQRDNTCPTCLNPLPTSWRFGKVSQRMVCQPCSLHERRTGKQRTPEMEAQRVLREMAGARR
ncbi:hypothetical protein HMN09_00134100 [Mycena chlorophos]|uniref:GATA-type domain-containing protein n=1 Tax=Mycena chlorophos TaxID=658473 RepID=A0A8H6TMW2_MYCCL|nr:hypothetical protein HMN09_00134100 [Mycena chlorophos]